MKQVMPASTQRQMPLSTRIFAYPRPIFLTPLPPTGRQLIYKALALLSVDKYILYYFQIFVCTILCTFENRAVQMFLQYNVC